LIGASWAIGFANAGYKSLVYDNNPDSFKNFESLDLKVLIVRLTFWPKDRIYLHLNGINNSLFPIL
jgi:hypothetical protein